MTADALVDKLEALEGWFAGAERVVVAYSGGTDSTLVAAVATRALGDRALAVTAVSPSLPPGEAAEARRVAAQLGIRHRTVRTHEAEDPRYLANGPDRCYHCKTELYTVLGRVAAEAGRGAWVVSGANVDDLGDVRPGLRAAREHGVRHPLVEVGLTKAEVREAARRLELPTWDKPASACLSSRIAFGMMISVEELARVGRAERLLKDLGFRQCRVRVHGELVRIEVEAPELPRLADPAVRERVVEGLRSLGYRYVTLDLEGFRSGSMNPEAGP
ncbi:MAG: ATP-dependent sacrificial sulfur transferase LarE [Candidatus Velamenicoccus archaeovorus]